MSDKTKEAFKRLLQDLKLAFIPLLAYLTYAILMSIFVGQVCPSKILFGLPCAGCGMIRAFMLFITFNFKEAFIMHPGIYIVVPGFLIFIVLRYILNADKKKIRLLLIIVFSLLILLFVFRIFTQFGKEPITFYDKALIFQFLRAK